MLIERFVCGRARSNAYILGEDSGKAILIDAGMGAAPRVTARVDDLGLRPQAVVITHGHPDHIWMARHLSNRYGIPTYVHRDDLSWFHDPATGDSLAVVRFAGRALGRVRRIRPKLLNVVDDADRIRVDGFEIDVMHTPGHSRGSACLRIGDLCFAGDTVFKGNVGAVYLGGDRSALRESIRTKLLPLPDDVRLLPGHGNETSVGAERRRWERFVEGE